jgi:large subunit ribosomal protein L22
MAEKVTKNTEVTPVTEEKVVTEAKAKLLNYGVTPRKVRLVIDLVRGKDLDTAYSILENCSKMCAHDIKKLIKSAEANAVNNFHMNRDSLFIAEITANDAMKLKRILPRAKGSASGLVKRWSHVYVTLKTKEAK